MIKNCFCVFAIIALVGCGTLTGIPGHGGGKRFSEEQRLVSSAIKIALNQLDFSSLRQKRVGIIFSLIADEGGGNIVGGRASISAILTQGQVVIPTANTQNTVDIFQVSSSGTSTATNTTTGTTSSTGSNTSSSTSAVTGTTAGTSTTTENETTTSTATSSANTTTNTTNGTTSGTNNSNTTTNGTTNTSDEGTSSSNSSQNSSNSAITGQPLTTGSSTEQSGRQSERSVSIEYEGLGEYQNLAVPKSDASFLMGALRNRLLLSGVSVTVPEDPSIDAMLYVEVPVLGTNRQRTDLVIYNNEMLRAEAHIEVFALDKLGNIVMPVQVGNIETYYSEDYILWSGPFEPKIGVNQAKGLIKEVP